MSFPLSYYALAVIGGGLAAWSSLPWWRAWCLRTGHVDDPGQRKIHAQPIPLAGGLAVFTGLAAPLLAAGFLLGFGWIDSSILQHGFGRRIGELAGVIGGACGMLVLGWLDDRYELRPTIKFGGQLLIAILVAASGIRITLFVPSLTFSVAITALWIVTITNAFNLMDNMNGLCAGLGAIAAFHFGMKAAVAGQYLVAMLAFLVFGSLLGFLPHNFPRATAFLGDAGSHLVGYLLAVLAILPHFYSDENPARLSVLNPLLILAVPLADMAWVVILRWRAGKPFYVGDTNHLSHRLVRRGLSRSEAVLLIWLLGAIVGTLTFL